VRIKASSLFRLSGTISAPHWWYADTSRVPAT
jgi:hypothetical protein